MSRAGLEEQHLLNGNENLDNTSRRGTDVEEGSPAHSLEAIIPRPWESFEIGHPFILFEVQQPKSDGDDDEVKEPHQHGEPPIGHPSVLMILSCVMWTMWTVGMFLACLGFQWSSFAA